MSDDMKRRNEVFETLVKGVGEGLGFPKDPCFLDSMIETCTFAQTFGEHIAANLEEMTEVVHLVTVFRGGGAFLALGVQMRNIAQQLSL